MPRRPSSSGFSLSIDDDFDESSSYRVKLWEIEERESQFTDAKAGAMAIVWKLNIYRDDGTAFEDPRTGEAFECWAWTSDSTFGTSKGRGYIEAFVGGSMKDEEVDALIDSGFAEGLVGKTARASFEIYTTSDGNERLKLLLLRPDKAPPKAARAVAGAPTAPDPEPEPAAAAPAAARGRRRIDE
jgi:hypothetical protein